MNGFLDKEDGVGDMPIGKETSLFLEIKEGTRGLSLDAKILDIIL